jgi:hypothetical protein
MAYKNKKSARGRFFHRFLAEQASADLLSHEKPQRSKLLKNSFKNIYIAVLGEIMWFLQVPPHPANYGILIGIH